MLPQDKKLRVVPTYTLYDAAAEDGRQIHPFYLRFRLLPNKYEVPFHHLTPPPDFQTQTVHTNLVQQSSREKTIGGQLPPLHTRQLSALREHVESPYINRYSPFTTHP